MWAEITEATAKNKREKMYTSTQVSDSVLITEREMFELAWFWMNAEILIDDGIEFGLAKNFISRINKTSSE